jgi:3-isopropylmalate/(R)-2-methylmalate dehydratase small subunit
MGTPLVSCPGIRGLVKRWDEVEVDWQHGVLRNLTSGATQPFEPLSTADREMVETGGLVPYLKRAKASEGAAAQSQER